MPTTWSGNLPAKLTGTVIYVEHYASTDSSGLQKSHEIDAFLHLRLRIDPAQSDSTRTVWVDDAGSWSVTGSGSARGPDCTAWTEAYTGDGGFGFGAAPTWNPGVEGTATVQVIVDRSAPAPPGAGGPMTLLTFSLVGHVGENGTLHRADGSCVPFREDSFWSIPTSMAGGELQGFFFTDPTTGIDYLGLKVPEATVPVDPNNPPAFQDFVTTPESPWPLAALEAAP